MKIKLMAVVAILFMSLVVLINEKRANRKKKTKTEKCKKETET